MVTESRDLSSEAKPFSKTTLFYHSRFHIYFFISLLFFCQMRSKEPCDRALYIMVSRFERQILLPQN